MTSPQQPVIDDELIRARVRAVLAEGSPLTSWERLLRHPLSAVAAGFILTGVLGALLQFSFELRKQRAERREVRRTIALAVVDTVGLRLNDMYYRIGRYYDALRDSAQAADREPRARSLDSAQAAFETREFVDGARVCVHLGADLQVDFRAVADSLHWSRVFLRRFAAHSMRPDTAAAHIYSLRSQIDRFTLSMVQRAAGLREELADCSKPRFVRPK